MSEPRTCALSSCGSPVDASEPKPEDVFVVDSDYSVMRFCSRVCAARHLMDLCFYDYQSDKFRLKMANRDVDSYYELLDKSWWKLLWLRITGEI